MKIIGMIEPLPADNSGTGGTGEVREISVDAQTYEAGVAELRTQIPDGWRLMNLRRAA